MIGYGFSISVKCKSYIATVAYAVNVNSSLLKKLCDEFTKFHLIKKLYFYTFHGYSQVGGVCLGATVLAL